MSATITFKKADGPITFRVQGDYATKGECSLMYRMKDNTGYVLYPGGHLQVAGNEPADAVIVDPADPQHGLDPNKISRVRIHGSYGPAEGHSIVKVFYRFFQQASGLPPSGAPLPAQPPEEMVFQQNNVAQSSVDDERAFDFVGV